MHAISVYMLSHIGTYKVLCSLTLCLVCAVTMETYCCTFLDLLLFFSPNVLSSMIRSAFLQFMISVFLWSCEVGRPTMTCAFV